MKTKYVVPSAFFIAHITLVIASDAEIGREYYSAQEITADYVENTEISQDSIFLDSPLIGWTKEDLIHFGITDNLSLVYEALVEWANEDSISAFNWLLDNGTNDQRAQLEAAILPALVKQYSSTAFGWSSLLVNPDSVRSLEYLFAENLAEKDIQAAYLWAVGRHDRGWGLDAMQAVVYEWVKIGANSVVDKLAEITDPEIRKVFLMGGASAIAYEMIIENPVAVFEWADTLGPEERMLAIPALFSEWVLTDSVQARAWLADQPDSVQKREMMTTALWSIASTEIDTVMQELPGVLKGEGYYDGLVGLVAQTLEELRPQEVDAWINSLVGEYWQSVARTYIAESRMFNDPEKFLAEFALQTGEFRTAYLALILTSLTEYRPLLVSAWHQQNSLDESELNAATLWAEMFYVEHGC